MESDESLLPISKKTDGNTIAEDIIGFAADETWGHAVWRYHIEKRIKKINKIREKMKKED